MKENLILTPVEIAYFKNVKRFDSLLKEFKKRKRISKILNVGSGLCNLEIELAKLGFKNFTCVEPNKRYINVMKHFHNRKIPKIKLYKILIQKFHTKLKFDIIVLHDIFYISKLKIKKVLSHVIPFLNNNGVIYFDIYNAKYFSVAKFFSPTKKQYHDSLEIKKFMENNGFFVSIKPINISNSARMKVLGRVKIYPYLLFVCEKIY